MASLHFFSLENATDSLSWITGTSCFVKLSIIKSKTYFFSSVKICDLTLKFLKLPQIWNNFPFPGVIKMDELLWHFVWTFFFQVLVSAVNQDSEHTSLLNSPSSSGETTPIPRPLMVSYIFLNFQRKPQLKFNKFHKFHVIKCWNREVSLVWSPSVHKILFEDSKL